MARLGVSVVLIDKVLFIWTDLFDSAVSFSAAPAHELVVGPVQTDEHVREEGHAAEHVGQPAQHRGRTPNETIQQDC